MNEPPPQLDPKILAACQCLPRKPKRVVLQGHRVCLMPLNLESHGQALYEISNGERIEFGTRSVEAYDSEATIWRYMSHGPFGDYGTFADFLRPQIEAANGLCMLDRDWPQARVALEQALRG